MTAMDVRSVEHRFGDWLVRTHRLPAPLRERARVAVGFRASKMLELEDHLILRDKAGDRLVEIDGGAPAGWVSHPLRADGYGRGLPGHALFVVGDRVFRYTPGSAPVEVLQVPQGLLSAASISDDAILTWARDGSDPGYLLTAYALDGTVRWRAHHGSQPELVGPDWLAMHDRGADGRTLRCIDTATGQTRWSIEATASTELRGSVDDVLCVQSVDFAESWVAGVDATTGELRWRIEHELVGCNGATFDATGDVHITTGPTYARVHVPTGELVETVEDVRTDDNKWIQAGYEAPLATEDGSVIVLNSYGGVFALRPGARAHAEQVWATVEPIHAAGIVQERLFLLDGRGELVVLSV